MATSYSNPGGTGDRTATITASASSGLLNGVASILIDGVTSGATNQYFNGTSAAGADITFQFSSAKIIDEIKYYQEQATDQGSWLIEGSNDGSTWTTLKTAFTLGGATTQTISFTNADGYTYYRLYGASGNTSNYPYVYEFEFKIDDAAPPATNLSGIMF